MSKSKWIKQGKSKKKKFYPQKRYSFADQYLKEQQQATEQQKVEAEPEVEFVEMRGELNYVSGIATQYFILVFAIFMLSVFLIPVPSFIDPFELWAYYNADHFIAEHWKLLLAIHILLPILIIFASRKPSNRSGKWIKNYVVAAQGLRLIHYDQTETFIDYQDMSYVTVVRQGTGIYKLELHYYCAEQNITVKRVPMFQIDFAIGAIYPIKNERALISHFLQRLHKKQPDLVQNLRSLYLLNIDEHTFVLDQKAQRRDRYYAILFWVIMLLILVGVFYVLDQEANAFMI